MGAHLHEDEEPDAVLLAASGEETASKSLWDNLSARREEIANAKQTTFGLPGFDRFGIRIRYMLVSRDDITKMGDKVQAETKDRGERIMRMMLDTIIIATLGFEAPNGGSDEGDGEFQSLIGPDGETEIITWGQLAEALGGPSMTDRDAIEWIFGGNEFAIAQHSIMLNRWMANTTSDVEAEMSGGMV